MKQYLDLLKAIKEKGTIKPASRAGMPGTTSLFGYQYKHNLSEGFPLLTTKKVYWKGVAVELLWILNGDTNVKYLINNNVNIWNEDAYNYYVKYRKNKGETIILSFDEFINAIKLDVYSGEHDYKFGDCGFQYGKVWRKWELKEKESIRDGEYANGEYKWRIQNKTLDQIKNLIEGLKYNPESRRHIVTALDPANYDNLALFVCHSMFQFNCRPLSDEERVSLYNTIGNKTLEPRQCLGHCIYPEGYVMLHEEDIPDPIGWELSDEHRKILDEHNTPKYYLDCQLYQRSGDSAIGIPYNLASYSLLTEILCKICNMLPGDFIHTLGDVHIYDNHQDVVNTQLERTPKELPILSFSNNFNVLVNEYNSNIITLDGLFNNLTHEDFIIENYNPHPTIKAKLSTGLI